MGSGILSGLFYLIIHWSQLLSSHLDSSSTDVIPSELNESNWVPLDNPIWAAYSKKAVIWAEVRTI